MTYFSLESKETTSMTKMTMNKINPPSNLKINHKKVKIQKETDFRTINPILKI